MSSTNQLIIEICAYIYEHGEYPPRGFLSRDGKDLGKALTRFRTLETPLSQEQIKLLAEADSFLSRTEKNIQEIEAYYELHKCLPLGETNVRLVEIMGNYKEGKVPITKEQRVRLEKMGVFLSKTERMVRSILAYYNEYHKVPGKGKKSPDGYDMGVALIGYRTGKRMLTLNQKERLEQKGILLPNAVIKEEGKLSIREIDKKTTLADQIEELKKERNSLVEKESNKGITK